MSMHLESPLTITNYKKRKQKITKSKQVELEQGWRDRNIELVKMGLRKETFEQYLNWVYGHSKKEKNKKAAWTTYTPPLSQQIQTKSTTIFSKEIFSKTTNQEQIIKKSNEGMGNKSLGRMVSERSQACTKKPSPVYTGKEVVGIAVMHKSCLQPIFSREEAVNSANMRR